MILAPINYFVESNTGKVTINFQNLSLPKPGNAQFVLLSAIVLILQLIFNFTKLKKKNWMLCLGPNFLLIPCYSQELLCTFNLSTEKITKDP